MSIGKAKVYPMTAVPHPSPPRIRQMPTTVSKPLAFPATDEEDGVGCRRWGGAMDMARDSRDIIGHVLGEEKDETIFLRPC
jgi:hypothetical protein